MKSKKKQNQVVLLTLTGDFLFLLTFETKSA